MALTSSFFFIYISKRETLCTSALAETQHSQPVVVWHPIRHAHFWTRNKFIINSTETHRQFRGTNPRRLQRRSSAYVRATFGATRAPGPSKKRGPSLTSSRSRSDRCFFFVQFASRAMFRQFFFLRNSTAVFFSPLRSRCVRSHQ